MSSTLLSSIRQVESLKNNIDSSVRHGIIDHADAASQLLMLKKKEYQLKEKLVYEVHVTKDGTPRKIEYILFAIETGVRCGEIPSLKWSDINSNYVHIHSQQLSNRRKGYIEYYYADYTKDEKGESKGGRKFPLTREIRKILSEIRKMQEQKGIISDYVFCEENGEWITKDSYIKCLRRLLKGMGFEVTNNHAFRMSLNSNVLDAKLHLPVAKRAELLGHSVETNLKYYTYASKDNMDDLVELFDQGSMKDV